MTKSTITRERVQEIINLACKTCSDGSIIYPKAYSTVGSKEIVELARMALEAMDSEPVAEVVSIYGDPEAFGEREIRPLVGIQQMPYGTKLYRHAQLEASHLSRICAESYQVVGALAEALRIFNDVSVIKALDNLSAQELIHDDVLPFSVPESVQTLPENCVTAEHHRVIEMLLKVCGAAFELADDSCQQDVDGEDCHVVPDDAFQKLSDALDEIENTLPTEDIDRPDVFLAWSAMPRAALKSLLQVQPVPVLDSLVWSLQLAEVALEDCRINRIRCGHLDIVSKYKDGRVCIGLYQDEVDKLESAREVLRKVLG